MKKALSPHRVQRGVVLIEVMVSALLFVIGLLGLVGVAGKTISNQADVEYRTQASKLASEIMDTVWVSVDRTTPATLSASLLAFQHQSTTNGNCDFAGAVSGLAAVTAWAAKVRDGAIIPPAAVADPTTRLPGATAAMQQIIFNAGNDNEVTVRVCWRAGNDLAPRQHVLRAYIH